MYSKSNLKGFFFYYVIVRKDLLNKLNVSCIYQFPKISKILMNIHTDQKLTQISDMHLFNCVSVLEFLTNSYCLFKTCDVVKLDHFTSLNNFLIEIFVESFFVYEFFIRIY